MRPLIAVAGRRAVKSSVLRFSGSTRYSVTRGWAGAGLHAIACAPDGCVEAVEHPVAGVLAVQWHPEDQASTRHHDQALFDDLVARARESAPVAGR
jgi:carbamoylphosphate synthase small subunit